jgi:glycosyltransferase involved in cell wall biosynthesis
LEELYANTTLLVHPSENEGLPITVLQAMSYGRPVLVSDISEHKEVVNDNNFWFGNTDIYSLAHKIAQLIPQTELLQQTGAANKSLVATHYNWQDIGKQTIKIYEELQPQHAKKLRPARI